MTRFARYVCFGLAVVAALQASGDIRAKQPGPKYSAESAIPIGNWKVEFANGVTEACHLFELDGGQATVDEPLRHSRGRVEAKDGSFVITFQDDRIERWTPVGKRFVVEHWYPGSRLSSVTPVLGIAHRIP